LGDQLLIEDEKVAHLHVPAPPPFREGEAPLSPHLEDMAAAPLDLGASASGVRSDDRLLGHAAVGPAGLDAELPAHRFPTVLPAGAPGRAISCPSRTRIRAFLDPSSREAPTTRVWLSVIGMAARYRGTVARRPTSSFLIRDRAKG